VPYVRPSSPIGLIRTGISLSYDIREGWKREEKVVSGAPIPLYYNYEYVSPPINPVTNKPFETLYLGPRHANSLELHRAFS